MPPEDVDVWSSSVFVFNEASESIGTCGSFTYTVNGLDAALYTLAANEITFAPGDLSLVG